MTYKNYSIDQINKIRELRNEWKTLYEIATIVGCHMNTVYNYCKDIKKPLLWKKQIAQNYYQRNKEHLKKQSLDRYYKNKC